MLQAMLNELQTRTNSARRALRQQNDPKLARVRAFDFGSSVKRCALTMGSRGILLGLFLSLALFPSSLMAQCATCRAGGRCELNQDGKCLANRTFWGYYQGNWRKWPTVVAEERAKEQELLRQSPAEAAPSVVLPKPVDEARSGNPARAASDLDRSSPEEMPDPTGETSSGRAPRSVTPDSNGAQLPFDPTKAPPTLPTPAGARPKLPGAALDDPAPTPPVDPNDSAPSLPSNLQNLEPPADSELDLENLFRQPTAPTTKPPGGATAPRPQPALTAEPTSSERVAEYRRRLREDRERNRQDMVERTANLKQTHETRSPSNRPTATSTGSQAHGAATTKSQPAGAKAIAPGSSSTPHSEASRAAQSTTLAAAANTGSNASSLDDIMALRKAEVVAGKSPHRAEAMSASHASEISAPKLNEKRESEMRAERESETESIEAQSEPEPELLLSPNDTAESKNPLRENLSHARYTARMFTPQPSAATNESPRPLAAERISEANPLRGGERTSGSTMANRSPAVQTPAQPQREILPVTHEEETTAAPPRFLPGEEPHRRAEPSNNTPSRIAPREAVAPTSNAVAQATTSPPTPMPEPEAEPAPLPRGDAPPLQRAETSVVAPLERRSPVEAGTSGNMLRGAPSSSTHSPTTLRNAANPLRGSQEDAISRPVEPTGMFLPAKTPGVGRYISGSSIATTPSPTTASPASSSQASSSTAVKTPAGGASSGDSSNNANLPERSQPVVRPTLGGVNPLRAGR